MFKFMHSQDDFSQLLNLSDFRMCGRRSRDELNSYTMEPICGNAPRFTADGDAKVLHPAHPTLAWVAHGLWVGIVFSPPIPLRYFSRAECVCVCVCVCVGVGVGVHTAGP
jgi:hypothetical protein